MVRGIDEIVCENNYLTTSVYSKLINFEYNVSCRHNRYPPDALIKGKNIVRILSKH